MDGIREKLWSEDAKQYYTLVGAAAVPLFAVSTLVGTAMKMSSFLTGAHATGILSTGLIGIGAGCGADYAKSSNMETGEIFTGFVAGAFVIDGILFSLGYIFSNRIAPFVAGLNGAISVGTLVGAPLGGICVAAMKTSPDSTE